MVKNYHITLPEFSRGFHLITDIVLREIKELPKNGLLHIFIKHTSASLAINENADPSVRTDFETIFNRLVPEDLPDYTHTDEGSDDMPAHVKALLAGTSVSIPIVDHKLDLGTWQGIYLCEFRNKGGRRKLTITVVE